MCQVRSDGALGEFQRRADTKLKPAIRRTVRDRVTVLDNEPLLFAACDARGIEAVGIGADDVGGGFEAEVERMRDVENDELSGNDMMAVGVGTEEVLGFLIVRVDSVVGELGVESEEGMGF